MKYPDAESILDDLYVQQEMDNCWDNTKNNKCEYGFAIYLVNNPIEVMQYNEGETMECPNSPGEHVSATVDIEIDEMIVNPTQEDGRYLIGVFHTHPPLTDCDAGVWREPGPSTLGVDAYDNLNDPVPAFVYDYNVQTLYGGHNENLDVKKYKYGVQRRDHLKDEHISDFQWN